MQVTAAAVVVAAAVVEVEVEEITMGQEVPHTILVPTAAMGEDLGEEGRLTKVSKVDILLRQTTALPVQARITADPQVPTKLPKAAMAETITA